jgi:glutathione synthase/RimK-type ligase-like ATP-grasp enzyme
MIKPVILVWGLAHDGPTARVIEELRKRGARVAWIDQQATDNFRIELNAGDADLGVLYLPGEAIDLASVRSAYLRPYDLRTLELARGIAADNPRFRQCCAFEELLSLWGEVTDGLVMNRLSAMSSNGSKPYQSDVIRQYGFSVPDTLITSDPQAALAFWDQHGTVIYKSMSGQRSIVTALGAADRRKLFKIARCITQFQAWIPGTDYRVHVVADQVFATRIRSTAVDHRYGQDTALESADIPDAVAERCFRLTRGLGLELSGVDLRLSPRGEWFCFEVNPSPGFTYHEDATGAPIGDAIASALCE